MRKIIFSAFLLGFLALISWASNPSRAATSTHVITEGAWSVYMFDEGGQKVCFISGTPVSAKGNYTKRGEIFALVSERPAEGAQNVFSYRTGYTYDLKSPITLSVGSKNFTLYSSDSTPDTAWAASQDDDNAITAALSAGKTFVVKGRSARGSDTTDSFSLTGFKKALKASQSACKGDDKTEKETPKIN